MTDSGFPVLTVCAALLCAGLAVFTLARWVGREADRTDVARVGVPMALLGVLLGGFGVAYIESALWYDRSVTEAVAR